MILCPPNLGQANCWVETRDEPMPGLRGLRLGRAVRWHPQTFLCAGGQLSVLLGGRGAIDPLLGGNFSVANCEFVRKRRCSGNHLLSAPWKKGGFALQCVLVSLRLRALCCRARAGAGQSARAGRRHCCAPAAFSIAWWELTSGCAAFVSPPTLLSCDPLLCWSPGFLRWQQAQNLRPSSFLQAFARCPDQMFLEAAANVLLNLPTSISGFLRGFSRNLPFRRPLTLFLRLLQDQRGSLGSLPSFTSRRWFAHGRPLLPFNPFYISSSK